MTSTMDTLPIELFTRILCLSTCAPSLLRTISSGWKAKVDGEPSLWTSLNVDLYRSRAPLQQIEVFARLSRTRLIDVTLTLLDLDDPYIPLARRDDPYNKSGAFPPNLFAQVMAALVSLSARWHAFTVDYGQQYLAVARVLPWLSQAASPRLRTFTVLDRPAMPDKSDKEYVMKYTIVRAADSQNLHPRSVKRLEHVRNAPLHFPAVEIARLEHYPGIALSLPLAHMRALHIGFHPTVIAFEFLVHLSKEALQLRCLTLAMRHSCDEEFVGHSHTSAVFPSLLYLHIKDCESDVLKVVVTHLSAPNLKSFHITNLWSQYARLWGQYTLPTTAIDIFKARDPLMPALEMLKISDMRSVGTGFFAEVLHYVPSLRTVMLDQCENAREWLTALGNPHPDGVRTLPCLQLETLIIFGFTSRLDRKDFAGIVRQRADSGCLQRVLLLNDRMKGSIAETDCVDIREVIEVSFEDGHIQDGKYIQGLTGAELVQKYESEEREVWGWHGYESW